jgi:hypothetical protein
MVRATRLSGGNRARPIGYDDLSIGEGVRGAALDGEISTGVEIFGCRTNKKSHEIGASFQRRQRCRVNRHETRLQSHGEIRFAGDENLKTPSE